MSVTLNLLAPEKKRALQTGFIMAFAQTMMFIFFVVAAFVAGTILSVRFVLANTYESLTNQTTEAADESDRAAEDTKVINVYLKRIDGLQKHAVAWSGVLAALSAATPDGVTAEFVSVERDGKILIRGRADDRDDVIELRRRLLEIPLITGVSNPLSNLLQKKDVKFEFEMQYAPLKTAPAK